MVIPVLNQVRDDPEALHLPRQRVGSFVMVTNHVPEEHKGRLVHSVFLICDDVLPTSKHLVSVQTHPLWAMVIKTRRIVGWTPQLIRFRNSSTCTMT